MSDKPYLPTLDQLPLNPQPLEEELELLAAHRTRHQLGNFHPQYWDWARSVLLTGPDYEQIIRDQALRIKELEEAPKTPEGTRYAPTYLSPLNTYATEEEAQKYIERVIAPEHRHLWSVAPYNPPEAQ